MSDRAWTRDTLSPSDWIVPLPAEAVDEIEAVVQRLRREPLPTLLLSPDQFALTRCRDVMAAVGRQLRDGIGLAVLDRVPVERFSAEENRAVGWILGSLLGRLVAQKWDGAMLYDVRDTGRALTYGVRRSVTNLDLQFHTDAPWLAEPPELVGLLCLIASIALYWKTRALRWWLLIALFAKVAISVGTILYVYPINDVLMVHHAANINPAAAVELTRHWLFADRVRFLIKVVGLLSLLRALQLSGMAQKA